MSFSFCGLLFKFFLMMSMFYSRPIGNAGLLKCVLLVCY